MTKGVSPPATTRARDRDAPLNPIAPAANIGTDDDHVDSFGSMLDTAARRRTQTTESDHRGHRAQAEERAGADDNEANYLSPADLALAWLASRDMTPTVSGDSKVPDETTAGRRAGSDSDETTSPTDSLGNTTLASATTGSSSDIEPRETAAQLPPRLAHEPAAESVDSTAGAKIASLETINKLVRSVATGTVADPLPASPLDPAAVNGGRQSDPARERPSAVATEPAGRPSGRRTVATEVGAVAGEKGAGPTHSDRDSEGKPSAVAERQAQRPVSSKATGSTATAEGSPTATQSRSVETTTKASGVAESSAYDHVTGAWFVRANAMFTASLTATLTRVQHSADGSYHLTTVLNPPSLGRVDAAIKVNGAAVEITITPHTAEGHETLASHLEELRRELGAEHGEVHLSLSDNRDHRRERDDAEHWQVPPRRHEDEALAVTQAPAADSSLHIIL